MAKQDEIMLVCKPGKADVVRVALNAIGQMSSEAYVEAAHQFTSPVTRIVEHAHVLGMYVLAMYVNVVAIRKPLDEDDVSREDCVQKYEGVQAGP
jgi:hypothetical protein